jgi:hypothetical protein
MNMVPVNRKSALKSAHHHGELAIYDPGLETKFISDISHTDVISIPDTHP